MLFDTFRDTLYNRKFNEKSTIQQPNLIEPYDSVFLFDTVVSGECLQNEKTESLSHNQPLFPVKFFCFSALTSNYCYLRNTIFINQECNITNRYIMAVNQSQVDHIITAASEDDPEVKLQNLEREVDLIKTSIKRLLMDIRERMNELENPFTLTATGAGGALLQSPSAASDMRQTKQKNLHLKHGKLLLMPANPGSMQPKQRMEAEKYKNEAAGRVKSVIDRNLPVQPLLKSSTKMLDDQVLALLRSQVASPPENRCGNDRSGPLTAAPTSEKLRLQKVYKLFKWTHQSVKKFGHDRLEIMLESYRAMGYITKESCDEIREISRLMPANLGEEHEVGPDEFVSELYALNRILAPERYLT